MPYSIMMELFQKYIRTVRMSIEIIFPSQIMKRRKSVISSSIAMEKNLIQKNGRMISKYGFQLKIISKYNASGYSNGLSAFSKLVLESYYKGSTELRLVARVFGFVASRLLLS